MLGLLDPGHDRDPQFLAGGPRSAVEDVLLQQAEEGLHGRVVTCRPDPRYRANDPVQVERPDDVLAELVGIRLGP